MMVAENRAVAPGWPGPPSSPPTTPTPNPFNNTHASADASASAMLDTASSDGKSRTLQGPSAKAWASHRETIIGLYRQYPLKRVSEIMRRDFGFSARYARAAPAIGADFRPPPALSSR